MRASTTALVVCLLACREEEADPQRRSAPSLSSPFPALSVNRPTIRFYMEPVGERCVVFGKDGDAETAREDAPCPADLLPSERLRIVGMTCLREGEQARTLPVVCPDPLTNLEKAYRAGKVSLGSR